jgi:hypothetical protein
VIVLPAQEELQSLCVFCLQVKEPKSVELLTELSAGALFSFGLVYTGMVRPTKVSSCSGMLPECLANGSMWRIGLPRLQELLLLLVRH